MDKGEFLALLEEQSDAQLLQPCLRDATVPYIFEPSPAAWDSFRDEFVSGLGVRYEDIRVVGSARLGFSLKPGHELRSFRDKSDVDVAIVNSVAFDRLWLALLAAAYPRQPNVGLLGGWLKRRTNEVYTGWLSPLDIRLDASIFGSKVRPVLQFNATWFNTFKRASRHPPRRHEDVKGRLYRSWEHVELYHLHSLSELRKSLDKRARA